ncbi:MAE_28990/MAE_18760 family HEPN-like nuclease [Acrocarpospora sp. B8E8]|uniref:MAE_28990/MAE_18760 family HEPN-like nuclease n=1 Tax=Acrocarpospora sp. B8E8 TaxID=3153572 RepID=UPI00325D083E
MSTREAAAIRAVLENELTWRRDEIRHLRNLFTSAKIEADAVRRRALLVMLYAHLEGFAKFSLEQYAIVINNAQVQIMHLKPQLYAACLVDRFKNYRASEVADPYDSSATRARQVMKDAELIQAIIGLQGQIATIDARSVASADSNLSASVLRRNLALLALDESDFHQFTSTMDGLLKLRNNIAHGERATLPSDPAFLKLEGRIFGLCETLMREIYQSVRDETYLR